MSGEVNPVPEGFHTVTPYVTIGGAYEAIEFYKEAFGAEEIFRWADPDGRVRPDGCRLDRASVGPRCPARAWRGPTRA